MIESDRRLSNKPISQSTAEAIRRKKLRCEAEKAREEQLLAEVEVYVIIVDIKFMVGGYAFSLLIGPPGNDDM